MLKIKNSLYLALFILSFSHTASAQVGTFLVGNGGQVVVCKDSNKEIISIELFDFYEGRKLTKQPHVKSLNEDSLTAALGKLIPRFNKDGKNDDFIKILTDFSSSFLKEAVFLENVDLELTNDISSQFKPKNCEIQQIVTQQQPSFMYKPRYIINKKLWDALNITNKAGLVLHEILYRIKIDKQDGTKPDYSELNAINIRQIVYFIVSESLEDLISYDQFKSLLSQELGRLCLRLKGEQNDKNKSCFIK